MANNFNNFNHFNYSSKEGPRKLPATHGQQLLVAHLLEYMSSWQLTASIFVEIESGGTATVCTF